MKLKIVKIIDYFQILHSDSTDIGDVRYRSFDWKKLKIVKIIKFWKLIRALTLNAFSTLSILSSLLLKDYSSDRFRILIENKMKIVENRWGHSAFMNVTFQNFHLQIYLFTYPWFYPSDLFALKYLFNLIKKWKITFYS